jgi:hypothetical protein
MKKLIILISILTLIFISGCGNAKTETSAVGTDYTVKLETFNPTDYGLDPTNNENDPRVTVTRASAESEQRMPPLISAGQCLEACEVSVFGEVLTSENCDEGGWGSTLYTVRIKKSYRGEYKSDDIITIRTQGGYCRKSVSLDSRNGAGWNKLAEDSPYRKMSREELDNIFIYDEGYGTPLPKVGDMVMLFLKANPPREGNKVYADGLEGRYYQNKDGLFERWTPPYEPNFYSKALKDGEKLEEPMTFEELDKKLEEAKKTADAKAKE